LGVELASEEPVNVVDAGEEGPAGGVLGGVTEEKGEEGVMGQ
jgi:hypothetical protein